MARSVLPVFSLISHSTLNKAGFIRWQFRACFLQERSNSTAQVGRQPGLPTVRSGGAPGERSAGSHPKHSSAARFGGFMA